MIKAAVKEAIKVVAVHYKTTPETVRIAIATGNQKIRRYVAKIAQDAIAMLSKEKAK